MKVNETLTANDVAMLARVIDAAQRGARVRYMKDLDSETIMEGTARHIVKDDGAGFDHAGDVRDQLIRVTSLTGFDHFIPVIDFADALKHGRASID